MKKIVLLLFCMLIYMPAAFASTWQEDVDAVTSDPSKVYEVYRGMPYVDFEKAWADVPNWKRKEIKPRWQLFEKSLEGKKSLREEFQVMGDNTNVISIELIFITDDKRLQDEIFDYVRSCFTEKFGFDGQIEGCKIDTDYVTIMTWPGKHIMLTRGPVEKDGKMYATRIRF